MAAVSEEILLLKRRQLQLKQRELWKRYPLLWLKERLGEDPHDFYWSKRPEYENHEWDGDKDALAKAWQSLANGRWAGVEAATGTSKTYWAARVVCWWLDVYENSLVITSAPKQEQLKLNLWAEIGRLFHKFKKIRPTADKYKLRLVVDGRAEKDLDEEEVMLSDSWHAIGFVAGTGMEEQSATKAQGFHREHMLIILEEAPGMDPAIMTAFQNTSTADNNLILALGNPDYELDELHKFCMQPNVDHYRISAYDYPNVVLGKALFPGGVMRKSIEDRKMVYGADSNFFNSRVRGISPAEAADSLMKLSWIDEAVARKDSDKLTLSWNAMGIDAANSESGDKGCVAIGDGPKLVYLKEFTCPDASHIAFNIIGGNMNGFPYHNYHIPTMLDYNVDPNFIGIDSVGIGASTLQTFYNEGYHVTSLNGGERMWQEAIPVEFQNKPMFAFENLRAQMYWELREDLRNGNIAIAIDDPQLILGLKRELLAVKFGRSYTKGISITKKDDIKKVLGGKSPNLADAVVYWNWVRKAYKMESGGLPMG